MKKRNSLCLWKGLLFTFLWTMSLGVFAQNITVKGTVVDEQRESVIGATVLIKGTSSGTVTDIDGNYTLSDVASDAVLEISYVGMKSATVNVNGRTSINVVMSSDTELLDEIVVVGYGTQKKATLTGSVSSISGDDLVKRPVTNPTAMLQGTMPGVRIVQGVGQPGSEAVQIRVRGQGTYSDAGSDPLILVDGVAGSLSDLNANDIESISVLKDAASASIYGARAANGVILVTTKSGKDGGFKINYNANLGFHSPTKMLDLVTNSAEYMTLFNEARTNSGLLTGLYPQAEIDKYRNATDRVKYPNFDWLDYMFNNAFVQNHSLSLNGGNAGTTYNITLGYIDQPGTMKGFEYQKYNLRANLKSELKSWITVGANISMQRGKQKQPRQSQDDAFLSTLAQAPTYAPFLPDGRGVYTAYDFEYRNKNMAAIIDNDVLKRTVDYSISTQIWADIKLMKDLTWYSKMAVNFDDESYKDWRPVVDLYNFHSGERVASLDTGGEGLIARNTRNYYTNFFTYLKYDTKLNESHNLGLQVGYNQESNNNQYLQGYRQKYVTNNLYELNAGTEAVQTTNGSTSEWAIQSVFGRVNYDFEEKYLLEGNVRYDGTSRIADDSRWGFFPSFSAAWRITEENFVKDSNLNWLTNAKPRVSYGLLGNQNIGTYPYQDMLSFTGAYSFDNNILSPGIAQTALSNRTIKWETTSVLDIGLDLQLFNKLNITYDWYRKHTYDILRQAQVTGVVGLGAPFINSGDMLNTGHEILVQYNDRISSGTFEGLNYGGGVFFDIFKNKLTKFGAREISGISLRENNLPYNSFYMLDMIGIFQTQEEIDSSPKQFSDNVQPGDFKYRDVNNDGKIDNDDRMVMDGRFPKFEYSINGNVSWKGFDLSVLFQGVEGRKVYVDGWGLEPFRQGAAPTTDYAENRWTGPGSTNSYPRLYFDYTGNSQNRRSNSWYLRDASFLRLKNLVVGYTIPLKVTSKVDIEKIRLYFAGDNLLTFTNYKGLDPERSGDGRFAQYPQNKILSIGVNVEF